MSVSEYLIFCCMLILIMPIILFATYYILKKIVVLLFKSFLFFENKFETKTIKNWFTFIKKPFNSVPIAGGTKIPKNSISSKFMNAKNDRN